MPDRPAAEPEQYYQGAPRLFVADGLYDDLRERAAEIVEPIATRPHGIRDFSIRDPNGVVLVFGQAAC